jgi:hypothetical protein
MFHLGEPESHRLRLDVFCCGLGEGVGLQALASRVLSACVNFAKQKGRNA